MKKTIAQTVLAVCTSLALLTGVTACNALQDTLSSEQEQKQAEETGIASINGNTWYFDGISTTDFTQTDGATLAVTFNRRVVIDATQDVADNGTVSYTSKLSGSLTAKYSTPTKQDRIITLPIENGTMVLDGTTTVSAGTLSADGKTFRLNMTPVATLLDGENVGTFANNGSLRKNELSLEITLNGFVCPDGNQKGRSVGTLEKSIAVKPLYEDSVIADGISFYTRTTTQNRNIVIPTQGSITLDDDATLTFASSEADAQALSSEDFTLAVGANGTALEISCKKELEGKNFTGEFTVSGIIPALNASKFTRTFTVHCTNMTSSVDTLAATTDNNNSANNSSKTMYSSDLESMGVYNDAENLYVVLTFSNPPTLWNKDNITILFDKASATDATDLPSETGFDQETGVRRGFGTSVSLAEGTSVEGQITTFVQTHDKDANPYTYFATQFDYADGKTRLDKGDTEEYGTICKKTADEPMTVSFNTPQSYLVQFAASRIIYCVPLADLALVSGDEVYLYAAVSHHNDSSEKQASIADHVPANALTDQNGSAIAAAWANGSESYTLDMTKALKHTVTAAE